MLAQARRAAHAALIDTLAQQLSDSIAAPAPQADPLLAIARRHGVPVERLAEVERTLEVPRRDRARALKARRQSVHCVCCGEWSLAEQFHTEGGGRGYAILVVRRGRSGGVPIGMDLLVDPVYLAETGQLRAGVDGYRIAYRNNEAT